MYSMSYVVFSSRLCMFLPLYFVFLFLFQFVCVFVFVYLCICICLQWWCVLCGGKQDQDGGRPNMDALLAAQLSPVNDDSRGKRW